MTKTILPVAFFFGANNKSSYCSLYSHIYNPYEKGNHIILKGGPGTGKSTIMRKVAQSLEKKGLYVERGYCSADPNSLDVVIAPEINFSILDGTAPHTFDPVLPGINEHIVDLSVAWDKDYLRLHREEIGELTNRNKELHKKVAEFLKAASSIELQSVRLCGKYLNAQKLDRYVLRLCSMLIPSRKSSKRGKEHKRFLSAVTPDGIVVEYDTVVALSEKIVTIKDEYSLASSYIVSAVSEYALSMGYDVYKCFCPLFPDDKAEHLFIPELKVCIFTENTYHFSIDDCSSKVHATRFFDNDGIKESREKLKFYKKAKKELIDEAVRKLSIALDIHDRLEEYYIKATDFNVINNITEKILTEADSI